MAKWIRCPKCQCEIDVADQAAGAVLACDGCGAQIRLPRAKTGQAPAVKSRKATPSEAPPSAPRGRQTALFRKMSGTRAAGSSGRPHARTRRPSEKKNNTPLIIGGVAAGAVVLGIMIYLVANKNNEPAPPEKEVAEVPRNEEQPPNPVPEPPKKKDPVPEKKPSLRKKDGRYIAPDSFESGAEAEVRKEMGEEFPEMEVDPALLSEFDELASSGRVSDIVKEDFKWMPYILHRLISDDEKNARTAFTALRDICKKRNVSQKDDRFVNPIDISLFNSNLYRAGKYNLFAGGWWDRNKNVVASWDPSRPQEYAPVNPEEADWDKILRKLRQGGGFDDPNEPGGQVIVQLRNMGKTGWLKLASFLDHEELSLCRSIAKALNYITQQDKDLPNARTRDAVKEEWEYWLKKLPDQ